MQIKSIQKQLNIKIRDAKTTYKNKIENMFHGNNSKDAWKGLKLLCGYGSKNSNIVTDNPLTYANELNVFYARFDVHDHKTECEILLDSLKIDVSSTAIISQDDVLKSLKRVKINKSCGPDKISGKLLKSCADQLCEPLRVLYQSSLDQRLVPALWKLSEIIPVPKIKFPKVNNDFRPVALTSLVMKCFEHIVNNCFVIILKINKILYSLHIVKVEVSKMLLLLSCIMFMNILKIPTLVLEYYLLILVALLIRFKITC